MHGWLNHREAGNWQRWITGERRSLGDQVLYPQFPNADTPSLQEWLEIFADEFALLNEIRGTEETIVIAHSLGATFWVHACVNGYITDPVDRVLLVAPAHPSKLATEVPEFFIDLESGADAVAKAAAYTAVVGGDVDEWQPGGLHTYADPLGLSAIVIPGAEHIGRHNGWGPWPNLHRWIDDPSVDLSDRG